MLQPTQASQHADGSVRVNVPLPVVLEDLVEFVLGMSSSLVTIPEITLKYYVLIL